MLREPKYLYCPQMCTIEPRTFINALNLVIFHFLFLYIVDNSILKVYRMPSVNVKLYIKLDYDFFFTSKLSLSEKKHDLNLLICSHLIPHSFSPSRMKDADLKNKK